MICPVCKLQLREGQEAVLIGRGPLWVDQPLVVRRLVLHEPCFEAAFGYDEELQFQRVTPEIVYREQVRA